jgi:hypothetical protein
MVLLLLIVFAQSEERRTRRSGDRTTRSAIAVYNLLSDLSYSPCDPIQNQTIVSGDDLFIDQEVIHLGRKKGLGFPYSPL